MAAGRLGRNRTHTREGFAVSTATVAEGLTMPQRLLRVAAHLPPPFHESDLAVAAWREEPDVWGLRRREHEHPDVNRIRTIIIGRRGLVARGWLEKVGELTYRVTRIGEAEAKVMRAEPGTRKMLGTVRVPAELDAYLVRLRDHTPAFRKYIGGRVDAITPADALDYLGCGPRELGESVRFALVQLREHLVTAADYEGVPLSTGEIVDGPMLKRLGDCAVECVRRHSRRLRIEE